MSQDVGHVIRVSNATFARLQRYAEPFRTHDPARLDTPDKVIAHLLDEHEATRRRAQPLDEAVAERLTGKRDATPAEIADEPDGVLRTIVDGHLEVSERTRHLAQAELDYRRRRTLGLRT